MCNALLHCKSSFSPLHVILSAYWRRIASSVVWLCGELMTCANAQSELPSQGSCSVLPPTGWLWRTHTASVPDMAVGVTNEAAVTLQTEAQRLSQNLTLLPNGEVQCASNTRCPSRSVCGGQDGTVGCRPGAVLHENWEHRKDNIDWFSGWWFSYLQIFWCLLTQ